MNAVNDQFTKEHKIVLWDEGKNLIKSYRDRPEQYAKLNDAEKEERWKQAEKDDAARLASSYWQIRVKAKIRASSVKCRLPVIITDAYRPNNQNISYRLQLCENLQEKNCIIDPGTILATGFRSSVDVYCDLFTESTDYFLSNDFRYRIGRPFRMGITYSPDAEIAGTIDCINEIPKQLQQFAHSQTGLCRCSCTDCSINDQCECFLFAKVVNKGNASLKDGNVRFHKDVFSVNAEEIESTIIGCGLACDCYTHRKCNRNIDLLHLDGPKLEIFRKNEKINFCVRTLTSLRPGDVVCEFTGHLETIEDEDNIEFNKITQLYSFQNSFDDTAEYLSKRIISGMQTVIVEKFRKIYNDLHESKKSINCIRELSIQPFSIGNVSRFISHGCLPNCLVVRVMANHVFPQHHRLFILAAQHIPAGSEILISYGYEYVRNHFAGSCLCNTVLCPDGENKKFIAGLTTKEQVSNYLSGVYLPKYRKTTQKLDRNIKRLSDEGFHLTKTPKLEESAPIIKREAENKKKRNAYIWKLQKEANLRQIQRATRITELINAEKNLSIDNKKEKEQTDFFLKLTIKKEPQDIIEVHDSNIYSIELEENQQKAIKAEPRETLFERESLEDSTSENDGTIIQSPRIKRAKRKQTNLNTNPVLQSPVRAKRTAQQLPRNYKEMSTESSISLETEEKQKANKIKEKKFRNISSILKDGNSFPTESTKQKDNRRSFEQNKEILIKYLPDSRPLTTVNFKIPKKPQGPDETIQSISTNQSETIAERSEVKTRPNKDNISRRLGRASPLFRNRSEVNHTYKDRADISFPAASRQGNYNFGSRESHTNTTPSPSESMPIRFEIYRNSPLRPAYQANSSRRSESSREMDRNNFEKNSIRRSYSPLSENMPQRFSNHLTFDERWTNNSWSGWQDLDPIAFPLDDHSGFDKGLDWQASYNNRNTEKENHNRSRGRHRQKRRKQEAYSQSRGELNHQARESIDKARKPQIIRHPWGRKSRTPSPKGFYDDI